ncbi:MAG: hypothetical protein FWE03_04390 [Firmicutes bacterium]|nr:hypothetical protein [Bacillota bacterium]
MKKSLLKKGLVTLVVALSMVFIVAALTACGGAPGWANNAETPAAFRNAARDASGWEYIISQGTATGGMAVAARGSHDFFDEDFDFETLTATTTVWFEMIMVTWFADADAAIEAYDEMNEEEDDEEIEGVTTRSSITRRDNRIIIWGRMQGNWSVMEEAIADFI